MDLTALIETFLIGYGALALGKDLYAGRRPRQGIACIPLEGTIVAASPREITPESVYAQIEKAAKNKVKGVIFEIDSPGGEVVPSQQIATCIKHIEVPTVALITGCAASGGYWLASSCDYVIAHELSIVGSIGVILAHYDISDLLNKLGIKYDGVQAGKYKDIGSPHRSFSEEERTFLEQELKEAHELFMRTIAENRKLPLEQVRTLANGLIYHGTKAKQLGLVDAIGTEADAIAYLEKEGKFKHDKVVSYNPKKKGFLHSLSTASYVCGQSFAEGMTQTFTSISKKR